MEDVDGVQDGSEETGQVLSNGRLETLVGRRGLLLMKKRHWHES